MDGKFKMLLANLGKRPVVQHSLMNDGGLREHNLLMITEPSCFRNQEGRTIAAPTHHPFWVQYLPTTTSTEGVFPVRTMIYVGKGQQFKQIPVESPNVTAVVIKRRTFPIIAITAYIPPLDQAARQRIVRLIRHTFEQHGLDCEVLVAGDFNHHNQLWGGDEVALSPCQGEAQELVDLIIELDWTSLLQRGTLTFEGAQGESTIDLVLANQCWRKQ